MTSGDLNFELTLCGAVTVLELCADLKKSFEKAKFDL